MDYCYIDVHEELEYIICFGKSNHDTDVGCPGLSVCAGNRRKPEAEGAGR